MTVVVEVGGGANERCNFLTQRTRRSKLKQNMENMPNMETTTP